MKSASFDYIRPETLDAACACLASHPDARIIAGGQSLVPMLAMRLARPSMVIDIAHIDGLSTIQETTDTVIIGAMVRQAAALSNPLIGGAMGVAPVATAIRRAVTVSSPTRTEFFDANSA